MDFSNRNLNILIGAVILLVLLLGVLFTTGVLNLSKFGVSLQDIKVVVEPDANLFTAEGGKAVIEPDADLFAARNAYDIALRRAREWKPDAKLFRTTTLPGLTGQSGRSDNWDLIFVSPKVEKKGFEIMITGKIITKAEEIIIIESGIGE